ncbi:DUF3578 domain-containing protein [Vibrio sp. 10N.261.49.A12]|uniref:MrcB family domain-containing protein n=2 Tax=unclassified Vibrio TaxID=2614977 RepID=UPI0035506F98
MSNEGEFMKLRALLSEIASNWVQAKTEPFSSHPIAKLLRKDLTSCLKAELDLDERFLMKASAGAGNWADVAWLSILDSKITTSTQSGVYPVYLFRSDGSGVYLSLGFGTTELKSKYGTTLAKQKAKEMRDRIRTSNQQLMQWDQTVELRSNTTLGQSYEWASAGAKFYPTDQMPDNDALISDIKELLELYAGINTRNEPVEPTVFVERQCLSKPFLLLAGISGTGKTRFVRKQVEATGSLNETYCLTSVRPDWHEPSDLLGYVSRLSKDGQAEYITTDVLQFIAKAWRGIFDSGLSVQVHSNEQRGECLVVTGDSQTQQKVRPYWLCLDEMNLAPVEQYFADYLSVLETRSWSWDNDQFIYSSDPLLKPLALGLADEKGDTDEVYDRKLRSSLGFDDDKYDELWQLFCQYGLGIPFNLIVAGTVNMDETTHGFSRKVIDRALSIDFGEFFPNDIDEFFEAKKQPLTLGYPIYSQAKLDLFSKVEADSTAEKTKEFFLSVNAVLKGTAFELAYRAFNELCLSVISFSPKDEDELAAVFDDFLMCKILPRVEGDEDKLTTEDGGALLEKLVEVLSNQSTLKAIWDGERADLLRQNIEDKDTPIKVSCRSKIKLEYMQSKLQSGFTSFWP